MSDFRIRDDIGLDDVDPSILRGKVVERVEEDPDMGQPRIVFTDGTYLLANSRWGEEVELSHKVS